MARAPVSKTGGWGFESLHSCQGKSMTYLNASRERKRHMDPSWTQLSLSGRISVRRRIWGLSGIVL